MRFPSRLFALRLRRPILNRPSANSRSVGKLLANDTSQGVVSALGIVHTKANPVVVSEIKLSDVAVQMPFAAMLIDTLHAALEDAVEAFKSVGVRRRARIRPSRGWRNRAR